MQGSEIAQPGKAGGDSGQDKKNPGALADAGERLRFGEKSDGPGEDEDDYGADGGGEVGVDVFHANFGEDGGEAREERGKQCPDEPGHNFAFRVERFVVCGIVTDDGFGGYGGEILS